MKKYTLKDLARLSLLVAVTILFSATPIGYIPLNPVLTLTIMTVPVAVGGLILGPYAAVILSLVFGVTSLIRAPFESAFTISLVAKSLPLSVLVFVGARLLVGIICGIICHFIHMYKRKGVFWYAAVGALTSFANSLLVINGLYLAFSEQSGGSAVFALLLTNGVPEAIAGAILVAAVVKIVGPNEH